MSTAECVAFLQLEKRSLHDLASPSTVILNS